MRWLAVLPATSGDVLKKRGLRKNLWVILQIVWVACFFLPLASPADREGGEGMLSALLGEGGDRQHVGKSASCGIPLSRWFWRIILLESEHAANGESGADYRVEKRLPASACCALRKAAFCLLEGLVDGHWESWVRLRGETLHRLCHPVEKEHLGAGLAVMAMRKGD